MNNEWTKSTRSGANSGNCVEARAHDGSVQLRDSKNPAGAVLAFDRDAWRAFLTGVHSGEFDW
jgi:hypothetical protein